MGEGANLRFNRKAYSHYTSHCGEKESLLRESMMSTRMRGRQANAESQGSRQEHTPAPPPEPCMPGTMKWCPQFRALSSKKTLKMVCWLTGQMNSRCRSSVSPSQIYSFIQLSKYFVEPLLCASHSFRCWGYSPHETCISMLEKQNTYISKIVCHMSAVVETEQMKNYQDNW